MGDRDRVVVGLELWLKLGLKLGRCAGVTLSFWVRECEIYWFGDERGELMVGLYGWRHLYS